MTTVSVRISEEEKRQLLKYGNLSDSLREGLKLYLGKRKTERLLGKLEALQAKNRVRGTASAEVKMIREDRNR